jgi:RNA polymerase sigma factor (sigma-70 family)
MQDKAVIKLSEAEIINGLSNNNRIVFEYVYDNYSPALYGIICRYTGNCIQAEDLLQEVFIKIWNNFSHYNSNKGRLFTWMACLTKNFIIDTVRSADYRYNKKTILSQNHFEESENICVFKKFDSAGIEKYVALLGTEEIKLINMAYYSGFSHSEISAELNMPLGSVKTKLRHAIIRLRNVLVED